MRFRIRHTTLYRYERPVTLGRHVFRFHPRQDASLSVDAFELDVYPRPMSFAPVEDAEGNLTHVAEFEGPTHEFRVSFRSAGETRPRAGSFFPDTGIPESPSRTEPYLRLALHGSAVPDFARGIAASAEGPAPVFLEALNRTLYESLSNVPRFYGDPLDPEETLRERKGSCRDLAVLFIACCRHRGIPARFVSGYFPADPGDRQHMHAWAEAWLPGRGWRAYDPTQGIEVGPSHIASAAAAEPRDATPIAGFFTGLETRSEMKVDLTVEMEASGEPPRRD